MEETASGSGLIQFEGFEVQADWRYRGWRRVVPTPTLDNPSDAMPSGRVEDAEYEVDVDLSTVPNPQEFPLRTRSLRPVSLAIPGQEIGTLYVHHAHLDKQTRRLHMRLNNHVPEPG